MRAASASAVSDVTVFNAAALNPPWAHELLEQVSSGTSRFHQRGRVP